MPNNDNTEPALTDASLLQARYGSDAVPETTGLNDVLRGLLAHRTVRAYLPDPLPPGTLETLLAAAQSAPSSSNLQLWSVIAVEDAARKARLAKVASGRQPHIEQAPLFLVWIADLSRAGRIAAERGLALEACDYLESFMVAAIDAGLAAQNAALAAESLGLGTCYIGAMRNDPERVAAELGLPPQAMAVFGLCVGRPDPARPAAIKPRLPQQAVAFRERYAPQDEMGLVAGYDERLAAFSREQGMGDTNWTSRLFERMGSLKGLKGRERMRAMMQALGFALR